MNRKQLIVSATSAMVGTLMLPKAAKASNTIAQYSDGVGVVDPQGRSLLRVHFDNTNKLITAKVPTAGWQIAEFPTLPSAFWIHGCLFTLMQTDKNHLVMRVQSKAGVIFVGVNIDPNQTIHPVTASFPNAGPAQTIGYMPSFGKPNKNPGGGGGFDMVGCVAAWFAVVSASVAVAGALAACIGAPELEPADLWALGQALTAWAAANALEQQQCQ